MSKRTQNRQQQWLKGHPDAPSHDEPPHPYTVASSDLQPFLSTLDQSHAYVLHVDSLPWQFKRRIFTVPVLLNITIAAVLCWRAYAIVPTYLKILFSMIGYTTSATVDVPSKTTYQLVQITLIRTLNFLFDFILIRFIAPWPWTFFLEKPGNPILWRWRVGFRDREIIIRVSRRWGCEELLKGETKGDRNPFFKVRVLPAIDKTYMRGKTGYLMMSKHWDLDFAAMVRATQLVDDSTMTLEHFEKTVLVWDETLGWLAWPVHKIERQGAGEEVGKQLSAFKDRLMAIGKEGLFFRWIELMQFESSAPGGQTPAKQSEAITKVRQLFRENGVDFDQIVESIGGVENLPGFKEGR